MADDLEMSQDELMRSQEALTLCREELDQAEVKVDALKRQKEELQQQMSRVGFCFCLIAQESQMLTVQAMFCIGATTLHTVSK